MKLNIRQVFISNGEQYIDPFINIPISEPFNTVPTNIKPFAMYIFTNYRDDMYYVYNNMVQKIPLYTGFSSYMLDEIDININDILVIYNRYEINVNNKNLLHEIRNKIEDFFPYITSFSKKELEQYLDNLINAYVTRILVPIVTVVELKKYTGGIFNILGYNFSNNPRKLEEVIRVNHGDKVSINLTFKAKKPGKYVLDIFNQALTIPIREKGDDSALIEMKSSTDNVVTLSTFEDLDLHKGTDKIKHELKENGLSELLRKKNINQKEILAMIYKLEELKNKHNDKDINNMLSLVKIVRSLL